MEMSWAWGLGIMGLGRSSGSISLLRSLAICAFFPSLSHLSWQHGQ